jgi:hypothetical protein
MGVRRWGGRRKGDQNGAGLVGAGPIRPDLALDDLALDLGGLNMSGLERAGLSAAGTGWDGPGRCDRRMACQNRRHGMVDDLLRGGRSGGGLTWGEWEYRARVQPPQSAAWRVWEVLLLHDQGRLREGDLGGV